MSKLVIYNLIVAAVLVAGLFWFGAPLTWLGLMTREELFPSTISWDGKSAWKRCESAIAGRTSWPAGPQPRCRAMHLCANEANLSEQQLDALTQAIRETEGCEAP